MTKKERILALEARVKMLEERLQEFTLRPPEDPLKPWRDAMPKPVSPTTKPWWEWPYPNGGTPLGTFTTDTVTHKFGEAPFTYTGTLRIKTDSEGQPEIQWPHKIPKDHELDRMHEAGARFWAKNPVPQVKM